MTGRWFRRVLRSLPADRGLLAFLVTLFWLIRLSEVLGVAPVWIRNYGDDILCLPLVLSLVLVAQRLGAGSSQMTLPISHGLLTWGVFSLFFEVILPGAGGPGVADPWDVLMYLAGLLIFHWGLNHGVAERPDHADLLGRKFPLRPLTD